MSFILLFIICGFMVVLVYLVVIGRCPKCKLFFAMNTTGVQRPGDYRYEVVEHWVCRRCGYVKSRTQYTRN